MKMLNQTLSLHVSNEATSVPNECWTNAYQVLIQFPSMRAGTYVEGWMVLVSEQEVKIVEHGWLELWDQVVDPTWDCLGRPDYPIYFAGYTLPGMEIVKVHNQTKGEQLLPLIRQSGYRQDGLEHPGYYKAFNDAKSYAEEIGLQYHLPVQIFKARVSPE